MENTLPSNHNLPFDPWEDGVLNPEDHARLVAGITGIAHRAGLGERYKYLIAKKTDAGLFDDGELAWAHAVVVFSKTGQWTFPEIGFCYGPSTERIYDRMRQMVAKLLRNIVDARVLSVTEILSERKAQGTVEGTAVLCPDFLLPEYVSAMSDWDRKELLGFLKDRVKDGKPTCIYAGASFIDLGVGKKFPSLLAEIQASFLCEPGLSSKGSY